MATITTQNSKKVSAPRTKVNTAEKKENAMYAPVYNMSGKKVSTILLPEILFSAPWKYDLVHQVVIAMQANARNIIAHTKSRGEVRGGGKKPWKQKGTGRARHGSIRSPIWVGGGVTHGPNAERSYTQKINKKMRLAAFTAILSRKFKNGEILFVDSFSFDTPKTSKAKEIIQNISKGANIPEISTRRTNTAIIALSKKDITVEKSFSNFSNMCTEEIRNLNPVTMLTYRYLIIENPKLAFKTLTTRVIHTKNI